MTIANPVTTAAPATATRAATPASKTKVAPTPTAPRAKKAVAPKPAAAKPAAVKPVAVKRATAKPALTKPAQPIKTTKATKTVKAKPAPKVEKAKKPKLMRDSFTIPKPEYAVLEELKQRAAKLGAPAKKSEILRAGIKALAALSETAFKTALAAVPTIKTGRPKKA